VFARVGGLVWTLPVVSSAGMPRSVRVMLSLALAVVIVPVVPVVVPSAPGTLMIALIAELVFGGMAGWLLAAGYSAITGASEMVAYQAGLAMAQQFNPIDKTSSGSLATLSGLLTGLVFIGLNLHLQAIEALAISFHVHPAGSLPWNPDLPGIAVGIVGASIALGLQLAAPVVILTFAMNAVIGLLGRIAPRMNAFLSFGPVLSVTCGVAMMAAALPWILGAHGTWMSQITALVARVVTE